MDTPRCQWLDCPHPGPYAGHKALHEHLKAAHNPAKSDDAVFVCKWAGCSHVSAGLQSRMQHLGRHTEYRPYICSHAGCKKAYTCSQDLNVHRRRHRAVAPQAECACEWAGCASAVFPGAAELRAHLERTHAASMKRGLRCGWARCGHVFAGGNFKAHIWSHLPSWYRPFACHSCDRAFSTARGMAKHATSAHPSPAAAVATKGAPATDSDGSATECAPAPRGKRAHAESPAPDSEPDDSASDYAPGPISKSAPASPATRAPASTAKPAPPPEAARTKPLSWRAPVTPLSGLPVPKPRTKLKLTVNSPPPPRPAKRPRLDPVPDPAPAKEDGSESELDIVITVAEPKPAPEPASKRTPAVGRSESDEIARAVAEIVDSPAWTRGAAQASAARMAASRSKIGSGPVRDEDVDDWEYCT